MGIKIRVPEFEIELSESWGTTPQEAIEAIPKHYKTFRHFLEEHAENEGKIVIRSSNDGYDESIYIFD